MKIDPFNKCKKRVPFELIPLTINDENMLQNGWQIIIEKQITFIQKHRWKSNWKKWKETSKHLYLTSGLMNHTQR